MGPLLKMLGQLVVLTAFFGSLLGLLGLLVLLSVPLAH